MTSPALVSLVALVGPGLIFVRSLRGRATSAIVLASLPWALSLAAASVALTVSETIAAFDRIASGTGGTALLGALCLRALDLLRAGAMGAGLCIVIAALLQVVAQRISAEAPAAGGPAGHGSAPTSGLGLGGWLLLGASLLVIPTAFVHVAVHAAIDQILGITAQVLEVSAPDPHWSAIATADSDAATGVEIGAHLVWMGTGAAALLLVLAVLSIASIGFVTFALVFEFYSFLLAGALCIAALWTSIALSDDAAWLQRSLEPAGAHKPDFGVSG